MSDPVLSVRELSVGYLASGRPLRAVESVSFDLQPGETLGLVGESGSGKSTLIKGMLRVLAPPGVILGGAVHLGALSVLEADEAALRAMRWRDVSIVPQSALNALNPVLSIGAQMVDTMAAHSSGTPTKFRKRAGDLLELVGLRREHLANFPHQLSGGMRQRVALALALALDPPLIVMDEPTTALDVIVESQILERVKALQAERGFAMLFITHDLPLLLDIADRVGVLYSGRMVELASVERIRAGGAHPYTRGLLAATPPALGEERKPLSIPGAPPSLAAPPPGCRFHPRCPVAVEACTTSEPALARRSPEQLVACHVDGHDTPDSKEVPGR